MPRHRRSKAAKGAVPASGTSNKSSPTGASSSNASAGGNSSDQQVKRRSSPTSPTRALFEIGNGTSKNSSHLKSNAETAVKTTQNVSPPSPKSTSYSFLSPSSVVGSPVRKISDVGAAIKQQLKQKLGVSFRLDTSSRDFPNAQSSETLRKTRNSQQQQQQKLHSTMNGSPETSAHIDYYLPPYGAGIRAVPSMNTLNRVERQQLVLWRRPIQTLKYFALELASLLCEYTLKLWSYRKYVILALMIVFATYFAYYAPGPHQQVIHYFEKKMLWCAYWVGLGVLSSVGLGTGLHTFLLYLGPHIASVTLAAYECHSLKFPEPPYPDQIICPMTSSAHGASNATNVAQQQMEGSHSQSADDVLGSTFSSFVATTAAISLWQIMYKVALESFMWGAGTALGELPPYFMARAARLSGQEPEDEEYQEYIQFIRQTTPPEEQGFLTRGKIFIEKLVEYAGFWGILACASIPNPFFDLAGITCGHFLVPFATFFSATLIGKAVIKMSIQQVFIILAFSEHHMEAVISRLKYIPVVGRYLQSPFKDYLKQQKAKLHRKDGDPILQKTNLLGKLFELLVLVMIGFFVVSLINSLAQNYHRRMWQARKRELENKFH